MSDNLDHEKVDEIREAINKAIEGLREKYSADHPAEFDEALLQAIENELDLEIPRSDEDGDPDDPHGSGINKGP